MQARYITVGDVIKVGRREMLVKKVEISGGRVYVSGVDTENHQKHTTHYSPETEVECE